MPGLRREFKWEPKQKTHLVLVDAMDEANGMASPIPYNQIVLFLTQPVGEPGFGTTPYDDWMRLVITHEYTHVLQLDMDERRLRQSDANTFRQIAPVLSECVPARVDDRRPCGV